MKIVVRTNICNRMSHICGENCILLGNRFSGKEIKNKWHPIFTTVFF